MNLMNWVRVTAAALILSTGASIAAKAETPINIAIGFTGTSLDRVNMVDGKLDADRPGWYPELAARIGETCGHTVTFHQKAWQRLLKDVAAGSLWAATNSSYKVERTEFGQYPMTSDGKADKTKAFSGYTYIALVRKGKQSEIVENGFVAGKTYIVERGSSIIDPLKKAGAKVHEVPTYDQMLKMVAKGRMDAAALIEGTYTDALERLPHLRGKFDTSREPLVEKAGYVMFSKKLYEKHADLIECFWSEKARLMKTDWFRDLKTSYRGS